MTAFLFKKKARKSSWKHVQWCAIDTFTHRAIIQPPTKETSAPFANIFYKIKVQMGLCLLSSLFLKKEKRTPHPKSRRAGLFLTISFTILWKQPFSCIQGIFCHCFFLHSLSCEELKYEEKQRKKKKKPKRTWRIPMRSTLKEKAEKQTNYKKHT